MNPEEYDLELKEAVYTIISTRLGVPTNQINLESRFKEDLSADSLDNIELVQDFEEKFDIEISDEAAITLLRVRDVLDYIPTKCPDYKDKLKPLKSSA